MKRGKIKVGTSGWQYKHWSGTFYPADIKSSEHFNYYCQFFDTVELNNSFYHLPDHDTFEKWRSKTPKNFQFSVKASRYITHMKKLKDPKEPLTIFLKNASALKQKLGPVLFQLPPGWKLNFERLQQFLNLLPSAYRYVFEFRNNTWYAKSVYEILREHNCAFCLYELDGHQSPFEITADFVYIRLHGPGGKYQGSYSRAALNKWHAKILEWSAQGLDVYIYFDNDQEGYAAFNARELLKLIREAT